MDESRAFLDRVFQHLPALPVARFEFRNWRHGDRPTNEGFGLMPLSGFEPERVIARVMDVARYQGNIDFVQESRVIPDPACDPPRSVHFYQRVGVPVLGDIHMELVLTDYGTRDGWRVAAWSQHAGTARLDSKKATRTEYNVGAWLVREGYVGYALSSSPMRDDVGRLKFAALTKGADAGAGKMIQANIEGMVAWSRRG